MRKKLNSKGFTLIELLAVIVILALIMVIAIPRVLNAMDSSRKSALHSSAKGIANWYSETSVADSIVADADRVIPATMYDEADTTKTKLKKNTWLCMDQIEAGGKNFLDLAGVSKNDVVISGSGKTAPTLASGSTTCQIDSSYTINGNTCASICIPNAGSPRVVLVASNTGKFYISGTTTYAISDADNGVSQ